MSVNVTALEEMQAAFLNAGNATFTEVKGTFKGKQVEYRPEDQVHANKEFASNLLGEITGVFSSHDLKKLPRITEKIANNSFFKSDIDHPLSGREIAKVVGDCIELIRNADNPNARLQVPSTRELEATMAEQLSFRQLKQPLNEDEKSRLCVSGLRARIEDLNRKIDEGSLTYMEAWSAAQQLQADFVSAKAMCLDYLETLKLPAEFNGFFRRDILGDRFLKPGQDGVDQYKAMLAKLEDVKADALATTASNPNATVKDIADSLLELAGQIHEQYDSAMKTVGSKTCGDLCRTTMCRMMLAGRNKFREALGRIAPDAQVGVLNLLGGMIKGNADQTTLDRVNFAAELLNVADDMALLPKQIKQEAHNLWKTDTDKKTTGLKCDQATGPIGTDQWLKSMLSLIPKNKRATKAFDPTAGLPPGCEVARSYQWPWGDKKSYYVAPAPRKGVERNLEQDMLHKYTIDSKNINGALWSNDYQRDHAGMVNAGIMEFNVDDVKEGQTIDRFLKEHRTTKPLRLFAGLNGSYIQSNLYQASDGTLKFRCKAFQSTSRSWKKANSFSCRSNKKDSTTFPMIVFDLPPNYPAAALGEISEYGDTEQEILLNQGSSGIVYNIQQFQQTNREGKEIKVAYYFVRLDAR